MKHESGPLRISGAVSRLTGILVLGATSLATAQDWEQWRGPGRNGVAAGFALPTPLPETLTPEFVVEVGLGYATPLLVGDRIYQYARQGDDDVVLALEPATGETIWRTAWPAPFEMVPAARRHGPGPKSTPTLADGRLFAHGMDGAFTALDAESGEVLWRIPGTGVEPLYHTAMSPLVSGDSVVLHVGGHDRGALTAFDVETGAVLWAWDGDGPAYGSPRKFHLGGTDQIVVFTQEHFVGVAAETGSLLWSRPFTTPSTTTSQTPLLHGDLVIQSGRDNGITAFRARAPVGASAGASAWETTDAWRTETVSLHMANPVAADGVLYGLSHRNSGQYFALDLDTGEVLWTSAPRQADHASLVMAGAHIVSLEADAELVVIEASREAFRPLARYSVAESATWAAPALVRQRILVKDIDRLSLFRVP